MNVACAELLWNNNCMSKKEPSVHSLDLDQQTSNNSPSTDQNSNLYDIFTGCFPTPMVRLFKKPKHIIAVYVSIFLSLVLAGGLYALNLRVSTTAQNFSTFTQEAGNTNNPEKSGLILKSVSDSAPSIDFSQFPYESTKFVNPDSVEGWKTFATEHFTFKHPDYVKLTKHIDADTHNTTIYFETLDTNIIFMEIGLVNVNFDETVSSWLIKDGRFVNPSSHNDPLPDLEFRRSNIFGKEVIKIRKSGMKMGLREHNILMEDLRLVIQVEYDSQPNLVAERILSTLTFDKHNYDVWTYMYNGECDVYFNLPPKKPPYFQNSNEEFDFYSVNGRYWKFPQGGIHPSLLSQKYQEYRQANAMFGADGEASGFVGSAVGVACIPNSDNLSTLQTLDWISTNLDLYNASETKFEMLPDRYDIVSSKSIKLWDNDVLELVVSESKNSPGDEPRTSIGTYYVFATQDYIYQVTRINSIDDALVVTVNDKIFTELRFGN